MHGIDAAEIALGPNFPEAWARFVTFAENLLDRAVDDESDDESGNESPRLPREPECLPVLLLAAHNGSFDFAVLLFECSRHDISWAPLERWCFVDTLGVLRALEPVGGCLKLQCLVRLVGGCDGLRAHRALDDCVCLRGVMEYAAARLGKNMLELMMPFAVKLDAPASAAQVYVLLDS